jgi:hypothetical protein
LGGILPQKQRSPWMDGLCGSRAPSAVPSIAGDFDSQEANQNIALGA